MLEISKTWSEMKALIALKHLNLQYEEMTDAPARYFIWATELNATYTLLMLKTSGDVTDFETNYKPGANKHPGVTTTTDGSKERLDCDITGSVSIDYDESPTRYQLKTDYDTTGTSVASSPDTTLYTYSGAGVIDLVSVNCLTSANWGIDIIIDGTSRLRITMPDIGSSLGLTSVGFDIVAETANKQFRWHPQQIGFTTSFTIKAYATGSTVSLNHLVMFRERIDP